MCPPRVCCLLSGGDHDVGGLNVFGLCMTDLRADRDPEDFDLEIMEISGEMRLSPAAPLSIVSDDEEDAGRSVAAVETVTAADVIPQALATILSCVETTLKGLPLAITKKETDALCEEVIHSMRDIQKRSDTKIKAVHRPGRGAPQSAVARPIRGVVPEATNDATDKFWAVTDVGRPKAKNAEHRTPLLPAEVVAQRLAEHRSVDPAASTGTLTPLSQVR